MAHRRQDCQIMPHQSCKEQSLGASLTRLSDYYLPVLQGAITWRIARMTVRLLPTSLARSNRITHRSLDRPIIPYQSCKEQSHGASLSRLYDYPLPVLQGAITWRSVLRHFATLPVRMQVVTIHQQNIRTRTTVTAIPSSGPAECAERLSEMEGNERKPKEMERNERI